MALVKLTTRHALLCHCYRHTIVRVLALALCGVTAAGCWYSHDIFSCEAELGGEITH